MKKSGIHCCSAHGPEYQSNWEMGTTKSPNMPKKIGPSGSMIDGPYGGKKPQS